MTLFLRKIVAPLVFIASLLPLSLAAQQLHSTAKSNSKWTINPFDSKVFIENRGQFNDAIDGKTNILYSVKLGDVNMYFTATGIVYKYTELPVSRTAGQQPIIHYLTTEWENSSPAVNITAEQEVGYYYTFPDGENKTIQANGFKKIAYNNIYPGIDIAYYFPDKKDGFEYDIIIHPGADIRNVKLAYSNANNRWIDTKGNASFNTPVGEITDHVPKCSYADGGDLKIEYVLNGNEEVFRMDGKYDKSKTIIIDPWTTDPKFGGNYDKAYDLNYDNYGNIYVYGAYSPFQLAKLNGAGKVQWVFNASTIDGNIFGGFIVDKTRGTSYLIEGAAAAGAKILKVNSAGALAATSAANAKMNEMWRPLFNSCNDTLIIGAGGTNSKFQATVVDTSFTKFTNVNVLGATAAGHSVVLAALDPSGPFCYMAMAKSAVIDPTKFNNFLVKLPLSKVAPTTYSVPDGFKFVELASIDYVGKGIGDANGMNGMVASLNWLYLYDGGLLKRYSKKTGIINDSIKVTGTPYMWGGLDADICDNVYTGSQKWVSVYNASMTLADTINMPDTVFDVKIDAGRKLLYACGKGFVRSVNIPFTPLSIDSTNATCSCNGTATANLCGGADTSNVTYQWSNGGTTRTITGLCAGKYNVIVTLGGCSPVKYIDSVTITQPTPLVATITAKTNVKCHGGFGNATVGVTGGSKPYAYSWSPGGGSQAKADTLYAGNYTVTVTDSNKCTTTATVSITQPPPFTDTATSTTANCGLSNGTSTTKISGIVSPYKYSWAPGGQTTVTATGLKAGAYVVTVTDSNGCIAKATTIVPDVGVSAGINGITAETCNGGKTATATINMLTGGTPGYTYSWSPGGQTNQTATGLAAVTYTATVTDANGCIATDTVTIMQPDSIDIWMKPTNIGCNGDSNGSVIASVSGGTGPYTYSWSPVSGTDSTITGLKIGTYTVAVKDANNCPSTGSVTLTQPSSSLIVILIKKIPVTCNGGKNGSATVGVQGGTGPYSWHWSPYGGVDSTADSLAAGSYVATLTDFHGCTTSLSVIITQPSTVLSDTVLGKNDICDGDSNGIAYAVVSGGTLPYTYTWGGGLTTDTIKALPAGVYTVTILDSNQCTTTGSITITQPPALNVTFINTQTACNSKNGSVTAVTPGSGIYTFFWSPNGEKSAKDSDLASGVYTVTITDSAGCRTFLTDTVPHSKPPIVTMSKVAATCDSINGAAIANVSGGTSPYTYSWTPGGQTSDTASRVGPGIYTVTVTDSNGCSTTKSIIVPDSGVTASFGTFNNISCNGLSDGSATATITGGTGPFSYTWSTVPLQTNATATGLGLGTYTVIISDVHNCSATDTITITQPAVLSASILPANIKNVTCFGDSNGSAIVTTTGGTKPYSYLWTDGEKFDTSKMLKAGNYTVTVTDAHNCVTTTTVTITQPTQLTVTSGTTAATCGNNGAATATGHGGTVPYTYNWGAAGAGATISGIGPGIYTVTVSDSNNCTANTTATIIHSGDSIHISASHNVTCFGGNDGSATVKVSGGDTLLYGFVWTGGQSNATATGLKAGIDTVVVTYIANGCQDTVIDTITQPSKITLSVSDSITCSSTSSNAQVFVSGGIPPYTYSWNTSPVQTNAIANLPTGTWTVTVTDNTHVCHDTLVETVVVPVLSANFKPIPDTVLAGEYVYFDDLSKNASTWWWTFYGNGVNSDSVSPYQQYITAGVYPVTLYVTDSRGCQDTLEEFVYVIQTLYIPNVFTPNGDGINDAFHITAGNMKEFDLEIYNRWGEKIFESKSPNNDWTGTSDAGVKEAEGTYYYILKAVDYENKSYNLKGYVELIR